MVEQAVRKPRMRECVEPAWLGVIDEVARRELGRDDRTGEALAVEVKRLSEVYTRREGLRDGPRSPGALAARLRFFLPRDLAKARGPVDELVLAGALPKRDTVRVLDVGAGLGATTLGALSALHARGLVARAEVVAVDDDRRALTILSSLVRCAEKKGLLPAIRLETDTLDLGKGIGREERGAGEGRFDLILAGFVLNELPAESRLDLLLSLSSELAPEGVLIVLEPALRETSRALHALRDALVARGAPPFVAAPCIREGTCPMLSTERDWCHEDLPLALPSSLHAVARSAGLRYEGLSYSYLTLRNVRGPLHARAVSHLHEPSVPPLRIVSEPLVSKGKRELFGCGAPGRVRLVRLDRAQTDANAAFDEAARGDVLCIAPFVVDDRQRAKIDAETSVEALATLAARASGP